MENKQQSLVELSNLLLKHGFNREELWLKNALARKKETGFNILFLGEYGRGKTTLLNALIGQEVLASSLLRLPTINVIKNGEVRTAKITRSGEISEIEPNELANISDASTVELTWDSNLLKAGVQLMEYPSLSEPPNLEDLENNVSTADLVVFVVAADSLYSNVEARAFENIIKANGHSKPFFIVNFWDRIAAKDEDEVKQAALVRLPVNEDQIFFTSSLDALEGNEQAQNSIAALGEILQKAADNREALKSNRFDQLAQICIRKLSIELEKTSEQARHKHQEVEQNKMDVLKNFDELKETRNEIQDNLSELRNGTRDVVQAKIGNFIKELRFKTRDWVGNYTGNDLTEHLNKELKSAIDDFMENDFGIYLRNRSEEQVEILKNGALRFENCLKDLYRLLPSQHTELQINENVEINTSSIDIVLSAQDSSNKKPKPIIDITKMLEVKESQIVLAVTVVGSLLFKPLAIFIAPTGLILSGLLTRFKSSSNNYSAEDATAYELQISQQAGRLESELVTQVLTKIDILHDKLNEDLNMITMSAEQDVKEHIKQMESGQQFIDVNLTELSKIRNELGL